MIFFSCKTKNTDLINAKRSGSLKNKFCTVCAASHNASSSLFYFDLIERTRTCEICSSERQISLSFRKFKPLFFKFAAVIPSFKYQ